MRNRLLGFPLAVATLVTAEVLWSQLLPDSRLQGCFVGPKMRKAQGGGALHALYCCCGCLCCPSKFCLALSSFNSLASRPVQVTVQNTQLAEANAALQEQNLEVLAQLRAALADLAEQQQREAEAALAQAQPTPAAQVASAEADGAAPASAAGGAPDEGGLSAAAADALREENAALRSQLAAVLAQNADLQERLMALAFQPPEDPLEGEPGCLGRGRLLLALHAASLLGCLLLLLFFLYRPVPIAPVAACCAMPSTRVLSRLLLVGGLSYTTLLLPTWCSALCALPPPVSCWCP